MKKLSDFKILKTDVFYRSWHILDYISAHPDMSELDLEAIKATIMDALVYKRLIDPEKEFLDLDNMVVGEIENGYKYEAYPFVQGIPLWLKEKMRTKCLIITGGIPISVFISRPSGVQKCVYDMNIAMSALFEEFTFYDVDYNSPTRIGKKALNRPFLEVKIDGIDYLIDTLTKRIFKSDLFKERYGFLINGKISKSEFDKTRLNNYLSAISDHNVFDVYINNFECMREIMRIAPDAAEHEYELEESKKYFKECWDVQDELNKKIEEFSEQLPSVLHRYMKKD